MNRSPLISLRLTTVERVSLTSVVSDPGLSGRPGVPGVVPVAGDQPRAAPRHQHRGQHPRLPVIRGGRDGWASTSHSTRSLETLEARRPHAPAYIRREPRHAAPVPARGAISRRGEERNNAN
ncbi:hypothetical protein AVEN_234771-1 [Araneus ventricosus]|uniref:Uncharacterized protein n=1 Tax=Araneus ventricosus TaxID=182803 RepID=A0A4Y2M317_ARAVE|nr:hypothetical protein AVEN_234771-1 [Araneus ventricosus]